MNFLLRSNQTAAPEQSPAHEIQKDSSSAPKPTTSSEGLIAEESFLGSEMSDNRPLYGIENGTAAGPSGQNNSGMADKHIDVAEHEGWITIPDKELPHNFSDAPDILSLRSLDRCFLFPGEQVYILACLSASKDDTEIITPFKVAAVMNKNGIGHTKKQNGTLGNDSRPDSQGSGLDPDCKDTDTNGKSILKGSINQQGDVSAGESLLRQEDFKRQTESLLQRFKNSHFFARISESNDLLWSRKRNPEVESYEAFEENLVADELETRHTERRPSLNAAIDRGKFDATTSGGIARNAVKCCSLSNGDIVVVLQVNVGVDAVRDPVLEILQFEKHEEKNLTSENQESLVSRHQDPCGALLKWLLPLDNSIPPPARPLSPPQLSSSSSIRSTSAKPALSGPSGSQIFSFGHFRSYSMSSLPSNNSPTSSVTTPTSRPNFDPEDWDQFSFHKSANAKRNVAAELLSFRGVSLEPERFSVSCGLEGIYVPGRRWRRRVEIIQPLEIRSFAADCNAADVLCVQIKNISPVHIPDVVIYLDAITIVFEEASKGGSPSPLPIACIEAGNGHGLPNLPLRRGEEHSFIIKPATSTWKSPESIGKRSLKSISLLGGSATSTWHHSSIEGRHTVLPAEQYAIIVSCRCNYTESKLFFKQSTNWQPRIFRDHMISVASEMSRPNHGSSGIIAQLPVQVLTLQVSNLTMEDLTMTVLAPSSFTSPPSVVSLSSSPSSPRIGTALADQQQDGETSVQILPPSEQTIPVPDVLPTGDWGCTHLWLQSRVPLGCVPSQSSTTVKLEVLPLTDGIITLDSLQIDVKEKGLTYVPEHSLKINATSSVATGIN